MPEDKTQTSGGKRCTELFGPLALGDGAKETIDCEIGTDPSYTGACTVPVDCNASWNYVGCTKQCDGGFEQQILSGTGEQNGGRTCTAIHGFPLGHIKTTTTPCNTNRCCDAVLAGAWQATGNSCDEKVTDQYVVTWSRGLNIGGSTFTDQASASQACTLPLTTTTRASRGFKILNSNIEQVCPDRRPVGGTCSDTRATYTPNRGCTMPLQNPTNIVCPTTTTLSSDNAGNAWSEFANTLTTDLGWTGTGKKVDFTVTGNSGLNGCEVRYDKRQQSGGVGGISKGTGTKYYKSLVTSFNCPANYTKDAINLRCNAPQVNITSLNCPELFQQSQTLNDNTCVAKVTTGSFGPPN